MSNLMKSCGFQVDEATARKANPSADFVFSLTSCHEGRAQVFEGLNLLREYASKVDGVLSRGVTALT